MFRLMNETRCGSVVALFITECPIALDTGEYPRIITFPISVKYSEIEQEERAREYLRFLNAIEVATRKAKSSVTLGAVDD